MRITGILMVLVSVILLSGCVTTSKYKTDMDRLQTRIDELEISLKQQESDKVALKEGQQQIEAALKQQSEELESAKKKFSSMSKRKSQGALPESRMPTAKEIQATLKSSGFYAGEIDGVIGSGTKEAIRKFQEANQLTPDGVVGSKTWMLLEKYMEEK